MINQVEALWRTFPEFRNSQFKLSFRGSEMLMICLSWLPAPRLQPCLASPHNYISQFLMMSLRPVLLLWLTSDWYSYHQKTRMLYSSLPFGSSTKRWGVEWGKQRLGCQTSWTFSLHLSSPAKWLRAANSHTLFEHCFFICNILLT